MICIFSVHFKKKYEEKQYEIRADIADLKELNCQGDADKIIKLNKWSKLDRDLNAYISNVATLNRNLILGEYKAAKEWINEEKTRFERR